MKTTFAVVAFMASSALAMPQVTSAVAPSVPAPSGCSTSRSGSFQIAVQNVTSSAAKRNAEKRQLAGTLTLTLNNGNLLDQAGRTGYIASNFQFQFDSPPQAGAIYTTGFSVCANSTLALGGSAIFYQCWSGSFHNLYDRHWAEQCSPIYLIAQSGGAPSVSQISDGQPQVPTVSGPAVTQISDGQPQIPTAAPSPSKIIITQISDGQPQIPTAAPSPSKIIITQISDGQPQIPTANPPTPTSSRALVSQISDGQPQVPTPTPAPSRILVTQISDGQPQVPTPTPAPSRILVTQISDGQPQVPYPTTASLSRAPVGTGGNFTATQSSPSIFTGAAVPQSYGMGAVVAGLMGFAALL